MVGKREMLFCIFTKVDLWFILFVMFKIWMGNGKCARIGFSVYYCMQFFYI